MTHKDGDDTSATPGSIALLKMPPMGVKPCFSGEGRSKGGNSEIIGGAPEVN